MQRLDRLYLPGPGSGTTTIEDPRGILESEAGLKATSQRGAEKRGGASEGGPAKVPIPVAETHLSRRPSTSGPTT